MAHRTTLTIEDDLWEDLRRRAHETGQPLKRVVDDALRRGLADTAESVKPVELMSFSGTLLVDITSTSGALDTVEGSAHR